MQLKVILFEKLYRVPVLFSDRKSIGLEYKSSTGEIIVRAPYGVNRQYLQEFLRGKTKWLEKHIKEAERRAVSPSNRLGNTNSQSKPEKVPVGGMVVYQEGTILPGKGGVSPVTVHIVDNGNERGASIQGNAAEVQILTSVRDQSFLRKCIIQYVKESYASVLEERISFYAGKMGVLYHNVTIKDQKTRWGSSSTLHNLNFNWHMFLLPEYIADYVIVHELAHQIEMNHSPRFWKEVEKILPDYRKREKWLKEHEIELLQY